MRIFVAGATGVIGTRVVPLLAKAGHVVAGMTRTPARAELLRALGATPVVCDVYDLDALRAALREFAPDLVLNQLTDLPDDRTRMSEFAAHNQRMYREGTRNLITAAREAGVTRLVVQTVAWQLGGESGAAVDAQQRMVHEAGGRLIRYGRFYGPGTFYETELPPPPRIHIDEAAQRTVPALDATGDVVVQEEVPASPEPA